MPVIKIERPPFTCEIGWIDAKGESTYDDNVAIGRVKLPARNYRQYLGRTVHFPETKWYQICAKHAVQLCHEDMGDWIFEPYYSDVDRRYFQGRCRPDPDMSAAAE